MCYEYWLSDGYLKAVASIHDSKGGDTHDAGFPLIY